MLRLNLGCGQRPIQGFTNIDRDPAAKCDLLLDIEGESWPFVDHSVDEIEAHHVLEHIDDLLWVMKECYRVMKPGALLRITAWHPASVQYWGDATHKHPITQAALALFSRAPVDARVDQDHPSVVFGADQDGVDFEIMSVQQHLTPLWAAKNLSAEALAHAVASYNNVVHHMCFVLRRP